MLFVYSTKPCSASRRSSSSGHCGRRYSRSVAFFRSWEARGRLRAQRCRRCIPKPRVSDEGVALERHPGYQSTRKPERYRRSIPERRTPRVLPVNQRGDGARWNGTPSAFGKRRPAHPELASGIFAPTGQPWASECNASSVKNRPAMQRLRRCKPVCNAAPVALCSRLWYCFIVCWRPKTAQLQRPGSAGALGTARLAIARQSVIVPPTQGQSFPRDW